MNWKTTTLVRNGMAYRVVPVLALFLWSCADSEQGVLEPPSFDVAAAAAEGAGPDRPPLAVPPVEAPQPAAGAPATAAPPTSVLFISGGFCNDHAYTANAFSSNMSGFSFAGHFVNTDGVPTLAQLQQYDVGTAMGVRPLVGDQRPANGQRC